MKLRLVVFLWECFMSTAPAFRFQTQPQVEFYTQEMRDFNSADARCQADFSTSVHYQINRNEDSVSWNASEDFFESFDGFIIEEDNSLAYILVVFNTSIYRKFQVELYVEDQHLSHLSDAAQWSVWKCTKNTAKLTASSSSFMIENPQMSLRLDGPKTWAPQFDIVLDAGSQIHNFTVELFRGSCLSDQVEITFVLTKSRFTFHQLTPGNYCYVLTPQEPFPNDVGRCVCAEEYGFSRQCAQCTQTHSEFSLPNIRKEIVSPSITKKLTTEKEPNSHWKAFLDVNTTAPFTVQLLASDCNSDAFLQKFTSTENIKNKLQFQNLIPGNYCLVLTPSDPLTNEDTCLCYTRSWYKQQTFKKCSTCEPITMYFTLPEAPLDKIATVSGTSTLHMYAGLSSIPLLLVIAVVFFFVVIRKRCPYKACKKRKIFLVTANDSIKHQEFCEQFSKLLQFQCHCEVTCSPKWNQNWTGNEDSFRNVISNHDFVVLLASSFLISCYNQWKCDFWENCAMESYFKALFFSLKRCDKGRNLIILSFDQCSRSERFDEFGEHTELTIFSQFSKLYRILCNLHEHKRILDIGQKIAIESIQKSNVYVRAAQKLQSLDKDDQDSAKLNCTLENIREKIERYDSGFHGSFSHDVLESGTPTLEKGGHFHGGHNGNVFFAPSNDTYTPSMLSYEIALINSEYEKSQYLYESQVRLPETNFTDLCEYISIDGSNSV